MGRIIRLPTLYIEDKSMRFPYFLSSQTHLTRLVLGFNIQLAI